MINFILGLIIGGLIVMMFMCILQINRINEMQNRINKAILLMYDKATFNLDDKYGKVFLEVLDILGGDIDDE